jgi:hypothetical protein
MSSVLFGYNISLTTAATPSTGFLVAYDTDGILKQKDSDGIITPIGGSSSFTGISSTPSLADVLNVSNDSETFSILMGTATSIMMGSASYITSQNGLSSLYLDYNSATSSIYLTNGYNYLSINNSNIKLIGSALSSNIEVNNGTNYLKLGTKNELFSVNEISLKIWNASDEILLKSNIGVSVSSADSISAAVFIGSQNSTFDSNVSNSVIIGGSNQYATQNDSVYIPDTYLQDTKKLRGTLGNASLGFTDTNNLILENSSSLLALISSSSSTSLSTNGVIISDTVTSVSSPNIDSSPVFISTKNSSILQGVHNSVIIGGENLISSLTNSVVLGEYVNINNSYTLPNVDGTAGACMVTDGFGNLSWQVIGGGGGSGSVNFANTNLTLDNDRIHNLDGYDLWFSEDGNDFGYISFGIFGGGDPAGSGNNDGSGSFQVNGSVNTTLTINDSYIQLRQNDNYAYIRLGETVFNENSRDIDFIVKGDNDPNLFFINGTTDKIGIGTNTPSDKLQVIGTVSTTGFRMTNGASNGYVLTSDASGNATWAAISGGSGGGLTGSGTINYIPRWINSNTLSSTSSVYDEGSFVSVGSIVTSQSLSQKKTLVVKGIAYNSLFSGPIQVLTTSGSILLDSSSLENDTNNAGKGVLGLGTGWDAGTKVTITNDLSGNIATRGLFINSSTPALINTGLSILTKNGNSNNYGNFITVNGTGSNNYGTYIDSYSASSNNYGVVVNRGSSVFNESGGDYDFRIEGDTDQNLFFTDASTDNIGIGNNTPLYKLQVTGTVSTTGFRMTNGASNGYVLTSDGSGNATWTTDFIPKVSGFNIPRYYIFNINNTTTYNIGMLSGGTGGVQSSVNLLTAPIKIGRNRFTSGITAGSVAGYRGNSTDFSVGMGWHAVFTFGHADTSFNSTAHNWIGLGNAITFQIGATTFASTFTNIIGVGNDPTDTTLQILHNDLSGTATKIPLGVDFPANRTAGTPFTGMFCFELYNDYGSTQVKWRITRIDTGTVEQGIITTNLPSASTFMSPVVSRCNGTSTTLSCIMDVASIKINTKY